MAKFREIIVKSLDLESRTYTNGDDEIKDILPLEIYLVPKESGEHDRYVSDINSLVSKQFAGESGAFIPMNGVDPYRERITGAFYQGNLGIYDPLYLNGHYRSYRGNQFNNAFDKTEFVTSSPYGDRLRVTKALEYYGDSVSVSVSDQSYSTNSQLVVSYNWMYADQPRIFFYVSKNNNQGAKQSTFNITDSGLEMDFSTYYVSRNFQINTDGFKMTGLTNAQGDPTFTKQIVQKDDGTLGYEPKSYGGEIQKIPSIHSEVLELNREENYVIFGITVPYHKSPDYFNPIKARVIHNEISFLGIVYSNDNTVGGGQVAESDVSSICTLGGISANIQEIYAQVKIKNLSTYETNIYVPNMFCFGINLNIDGILVSKRCAYQPVKSKL
ncbi:hypothetical protein OF897_19725 [Chryseobacterium formosus]|uniref:Uncharacterized protein n=1 Tax=Chryseobacterium formosus TaxID=1537363 RepID=A0ABT3XWZ2_9FLAO|nr:hypothetical protein [Chryseobacterium formosus]MCX8526148.1 hypothetical protein [Chryseobacterium formosus]